MSTTVHVLLFSVLRERVGRAQLEQPLPDPPTGAQLLADLATSYPATAGYRSVIRLAVNGEYVPEVVRLSPGDEVALITPVSGG